ncbi:MAG: ligase-associated DNA damage response exonuclease [Myxococcota bacterium]
MGDQPLVEWTTKGLYCREANLFIDPSRKVERAIITHGHSDHARRGCSHYLSVGVGEEVLRIRLGKKATLQTVEFGQTLNVHGVQISLHPAGHIRGSAQVRLERGGEVWVISGDYKLGSDPTCAPFELLRCHTFITESTFGLPIYRWPNVDRVLADINAWWTHNRSEQRASMLLGYSLGKTQRLLLELDHGIGPVLAHAKIREMNAVYRASGVPLPHALPLEEEHPRHLWSSSLILAPPTVLKDPIMDRIGPVATAIASGWSRMHRMRRGRSAEHGFVLSDHVDWPGLMATIAATEAQRVLVHHGVPDPVVRHLQEQGHHDAVALTKANAVKL